MAEVLTMLALEDCVQNGIELLDEKGPANWREMIDLDVLDISNAQVCIIGQITSAESLSAYNAMLNKLGAWWDPAEYGFDAHNGDYDELTEEWRLALSA